MSISRAKGLKEPALGATNFSVNFLNLLNETVSKLRPWEVHNLTNYTYHSSFWETNTSHTSQEISLILLRFKCHNTSPLIPVLSQKYPVNFLPSCCIFQLNIILPSVPRSFLFSSKHNTCPAHYILFNLITIIISDVEWKLCHSSVCNFLRPLGTSSIVGANIFLSHPEFKHIQPIFFPQCKRPISQAHERQAKLDFSSSCF